MRELEIKEGEVWHVKLRGATALITVKVCDVTPLSIEVDPDYNNPWRSYTSRYLREEIYMIEKVEELK